jgi:hypothetical protein
LENNYKVDHDMAEGIAEAIDVALKDQNLSEEYATKVDMKLVDTKIDKVIARIDALSETVNARIDALSETVNTRIDALSEVMNAKFEAMDNKFSSKFESLKHQIISSQKTTVILLGTILGGGIISIVGFLLIILIKYMPVIAKLVEMAPK